MDAEKTLGARLREARKSWTRHLRRSASHHAIFPFAAAYRKRARAILEEIARANQRRK